jgi:hypothetical protein
MRIGTELLMEPLKTAEVADSAADNAATQDGVERIDTRA